MDSVSTFLLLDVTGTSRKFHATIEVTTAKPKSRKSTKKTKKHNKKKRKPKGVKKCIVKFLNKGM